MVIDVRRKVDVWRNLFDGEHHRRCHPYSRNMSRSQPVQFTIVVRLRNVSTVQKAITVYLTHKHIKSIVQSQFIRNASKEIVPSL